jgi:thioredoxin-dependent peroxiredoxin
MKAAPGFSLQDQDGTVHSLADYKGNWLVLYFYPKDDTPGCTVEACNFRDARNDIKKLAAVVGVSRDSVESHKKFSDKYHLNFTLLSDPDHGVIEAYDSWGPKRLMGKEFLGTKRNTFLIDPAGNIVKEYLGVDPKIHAAQIISDIKSLQV